MPVNVPEVPMRRGHIRKIPKFARVRTSEQMERGDMDRERNEKAEHRSEAKERNGLALVIRCCSGARIR